MASAAKLSSPDTVKYGFLHKRSQNKGRFTAENYKRRFFLLSRYYFKYYDGNSEKLGKKKGEIPLRSVRIVESVGERMLEGKENAFQGRLGEQVMAGNVAKPRPGKFSPLHDHKEWFLGSHVVYEENSQLFTLYILAQTSTERQEWVDVIHKESVKQNARFLEKYHKGVWTKSQGKFNCCDQVDRNALGCVMATHDHLGFVNDHVQDVSHAAGICPAPAHLKPKHTLPNKTEKQIYIAIYDYDPAEEGDLELCKGDQYEILDNSREHWWLARNNQGKKGYIPSNYVKKKFDLEIYDWYYKDLSRQQSESILKQSSREGCFLVRDAITRPGQYSLSLFTQESGAPVRHYHIKRNAEGFFYIAEHHCFESIPDVINYHRHNAGGLVTRLKEPPHRNTKPTTAGFGHSQFEIDPKDLIVGEQLGAGCFGSVHRGVFRGVAVAVKRMKENTMSEESFKEEAKTMTQLSHKNLVQLYGVVTKKRPMCIVTELMRNGALNNYLQRHRVRLLQQSARLLDFCIQVCQGMSYLESRKFIHRDLAARNCLVGENAVIKVADFGLARYVLDDEYQSSAGTKFPVKWAPPEVLQYTRFSSKSDVWAFGILMWEVFTCGEMPYREKRNIDVVEYVVTENKRLQKPPSAPHVIYQVMMHCWDKDAEVRPSFSDLQRRLSELNREADYPHVD